MLLLNYPADSVIRLVSMSLTSFSLSCTIFHHYICPSFISLCDFSSSCLPLLPTRSLFPWCLLQHTSNQIKHFDQCDGNGMFVCVWEREIVQWEQFHLSLSSLNRLANFSAAFCLVFLVGLVSDLTFTVRLTSLTSIPPSYAPLFLFFRVCHHSTTAEHTLLQHTSVTQYWTFSPAVCSQSRFEVKAPRHWAPALLRVVCSAHCCSPLWLATALPDPPPTKPSKKTDDITVS